MKISTVLPVILILLFPGCSTYENVTAYFNTYYNAQKFFTDAVLEVEKTPQKDQDTNYFKAYNLPKSAADKFDKVIEKCSKVIQFYPQSAFIDDCLMMIGKSYVYRGESESAIRKFSELVENFPSSDLRLEGQLWMARAMYNSNRDDEALKLVKEYLPEAKEAGEDDIVLESSMLEAQIMMDRADYEIAAQAYQEASKISGDSRLISTVYSQLGLCYERLGKLKEAAGAYGRVGDFTKDFTKDFQSRIKKGKALAIAGEYQASLETWDDLGAEKLKLDERGLIELERANTYYLMGDSATAFTIYEILDSTYKRTDAAAKGYFQRGLIFEKKYLDYEKAKFYYDKSKTEFGASEINLLAQRKSNNFTNYYKYQSTLFKYDSLLYATLNPDTLVSTEDSVVSHSAAIPLDSAEVNYSQAVSPDSNAAVNESPDLAEAAAVDSAALEEGEDLVDAERPADRYRLSNADEVRGAVKDTSRSANPKAPTAAPVQKLTPDSLRSVLAKTEFELAGLFYLEMNAPDSAYYWYNHLFENYPSSPMVPRSLYAMAEIQRSRNDSVMVDSLYKIILERYDSTEYAVQVKRVLGFAPELGQADSAEYEYQEAEKLFFGGDSAGALKKYSGVYALYPKSQLASKALYAVGWILENAYFNNDSAAFWYKLLLKEYPNTKYALEVKPKVAVKDDPKTLSQFVKVKEIQALGKKTVPTRTDDRINRPADGDESDEEVNPRNRIIRNDEEEEEDPPPEEEEDEPSTDDDGGGG